MAPALCENKIDAFVFVGGASECGVPRSGDSCTTRIVPIDGAPIDTLVGVEPYYAKAEVPGGIYKGTETAQPTFGTMATIVVSADMPDAVGYAITKAVFDNFDDFRKLHPALAGLTKEQRRARRSPFHPGAVRYFKEAGLD